MDLFILVGAGLLGASLLTSQVPWLNASSLWKVLFGAAGGMVAYTILQVLDRLPTETSIGSFIVLFMLGGLSGALGILVFNFVRWILRKR